MTRPEMIAILKTYGTPYIHQMTKLELSAKLAAIRENLRTHGTAERPLMKPRKIGAHED